MIRPIVHTHFMLNRIAQDATPHSNEDIRIAQDLADTLGAHAHECVGMAANMIGKNKRIIIFDDKGSQRIMYNPKALLQLMVLIIQKSHVYLLKECTPASALTQSPSHFLMSPLFRKPRVFQALLLKLFNTKLITPMAS